MLKYFVRDAYCFEAVVVVISSILQNIPQTIKSHVRHRGLNPRLVDVYAAFNTNGTSNNEQISLFIISVGCC